jgi:hypothetical protein
MAGGTHAFDMIKRLQQNRSLGTFKYFRKQQPLPSFYPHHKQQVAKSVRVIRWIYRAVVILGLLSVLASWLNRMLG